MVINKEKFRPIPGHEDYLISRAGSIYSTKVNRLLSCTRNTSGYYIVCFTANSNRKNFLVHRLLAFVFLDLPSLESDLEVDHIDGNNTNNSLSNLAVLCKKQHISKTIQQKGHMETNPSDYICGCGGSKDPYAKQCAKCYKASKIRTHEEITQEQIEYWVSNYSWARASRELGLSDNGLRKRYKSLSGKDHKSIKSIKHAPLA